MSMQSEVPNYYKIRQLGICMKSQNFECQNHEWQVCIICVENKQYLKVCTSLFDITINMLLKKKLCRISPTHDHAGITKLRPTLIV